MIALYFTTVIIGLVLGSFISSISYRIPRAILDNESDLLGAIATPRSYCPHCKATLNATALIPLVSFIIYHGTSRCCQRRISRRYVFIELVMAAAAVFALWRYDISLMMFASIALSFIVLTLIMIDIEHFLLPDVLTLLGLWLGLAFHTLATPDLLPQFVIGAIAGYCSLWLVYQVHYRITKKHGLGYGDFKLLAMIGAWVGWPLLPLTLLLGAALTLMAYPLFKAKRIKLENAAIPFGPGLGIAGWIVFHYRDALTMYLYSA